MSGDAERSQAACCLGMFAKYWQPGSVKTRLAADIGDQEAAAVYLAFVETLLERFGQPGDRDVSDQVIVYAPCERRSEFQELARGSTDSSLPSWSLEPQADGDLGNRINHFFGEMFSRGYAKVMVIGTDSPTLPTSYLHQAMQLLSWNDVVLGPSEDGGYYLVGARADCKPGSEGSVPKIFDDIEWSSDRVFSQTIRQLQGNALKYAVLPEWYDVDTINELERLREDLRSAVNSVDQSAGRGLAARLDAVLG